MNISMLPSVWLACVPNALETADDDALTDVIVDMTNLLDLLKELAVRGGFGETMFRGTTLHRFMRLAKNINRL